MSNPFGLEYADISGMNFINKIYGDGKELIWADTIKYEHLARGEVFNLILQNPSFFFKQLIYKTIKSVAQIGIIILPLLIIYRKFKFNKECIKLIPILIVTIAPGILVIPSRPYLSSAIAVGIICVFMMHDDYLRQNNKNIIDSTKI